MDEKVSEQEIELLKSLVNRDELPNTFDYLLLHGLDAAMSPYYLSGKYKSTEEVYAECLKRGIRWEDLIKLPDEDVLL